MLDTDRCISVSQIYDFDIGPISMLVHIFKGCDSDISFSKIKIQIRIKYDSHSIMEFFVIETSLTSFGYEDELSLCLPYDTHMLNNYWQRRWWK